MYIYSYHAFFSQMPLLYTEQKNTKFVLGKWLQTIYFSYIQKQVVIVN